jgi:hypothetical protein
MKKLVFAAMFAALLAGAAACTKQEAVIYNGCKGSWVQILQGSKVRVGRLDYGQATSFQSSWFVDNGDTYRIELVAVGYRQSDSSPMGAARERFSLGGGGSGDFTGPSDDLPSWNITYLRDSATGNNCER